METKINEIANGIYRLSTFVPEIAPPAGFTFNQFLALFLQASPLSSGPVVGSVIRLRSHPLACVGLFALSLDALDHAMVARPFSRAVRLLIDPPTSVAPRLI